MSILLWKYLPHWQYSKFGSILRKLKKLETNTSFNRERTLFSRTITQQSSQNKDFISFLDMVQCRQEEAKRSILVQVQSASSFKELYSYCSNIGTVKDMFHYSVGVEQTHFIIVEFMKKSDVANIINIASHIDDNQVVPLKSPFMWFRLGNRKLNKMKENKLQMFLRTENGNSVINESNLRDLLLNKCDTISEQMLLLYYETRLNDVGTRLRFLAARQVELAINGMFPNANALPFGSSVNGYGKMGCDLDLVLRLTDERTQINESRLVFHTKVSTGSERAISQRNMEVIGDLIQLFLPGCTQVRKILQARVPIIKYYQQFTNVECDLSMTNMTGVYMSDFLYLMSCLDDRVSPLVFTIKKWASEVSLTNISPGRWITNFSLTLLVLGFLQNPLRSSPILPSLNTLIKLSGPEDQYITEDGINCTFLRNIKKLSMPTKNMESLQSLLFEFFEFYAQFDFDTKAICLNNGIPITKPEHCALYIVNPLERGLNVCKNVSYEELARFKNEVRNAIWNLESHIEKKENWGVLTLFEITKRNKLNNLSLNSKQRMMNVRTLFENEDNQTQKYHNKHIKKQIDVIKQETQEKIKQLEKFNR